MTEVRHIIETVYENLRNKPATTIGDIKKAVYDEALAVNYEGDLHMIEAALIRSLFFYRKVNK